MRGERKEVPKAGHAFRVLSRKGENVAKVCYEDYSMRAARVYTRACGTKSLYNISHPNLNPVGPTS